MSSLRPLYLFLLLTLFAPGFTATANTHQHSERACSSKVDISTQLINFLNYTAIQQAADDAVAVIEAIKQKVESDHPKTSLTCDRIRVRKEWRRLTRHEKKAYILAEKCLMRTPDPGLTNSTEAKYFDGLTNAHALGFTRYHAGPKFLPWHRWHNWMHGYSLEKLCNYTGPVPYWDYTIDAGPNVYKSPIFSTDPDIGFGNGGSVPINEIGGRAGGYRVDNGAFANFRPALPVPHYLVRNFTPDAVYNPDNKYGIGLSDTFNKTARARVQNATDFWSFETMIDGLGEPQFRSLHNSIHFLVGGDEQSFNWLEGTPYFGSQVFGANDPIFYLHHANVDHNWWTWQQKGEFQQYDFSGAPGSKDGICDKLPLNNLGPDIPIALALKTEWYPQCYTYES